METKLPLNVTQTHNCQSWIDAAIKGLPCEKDPVRAAARVIELTRQWFPELAQEKENKTVENLHKIGGDFKNVSLETVQQVKFSSEELGVWEELVKKGIYVEGGRFALIPEKK